MRNVEELPVWLYEYDKRIEYYGDGRTKDGKEVLYIDIRKLSDDEVEVFKKELRKEFGNRATLRQARSEYAPEQKKVVIVIDDTLKESATDGYKYIGEAFFQENYRGLSSNIRTNDYDDLFDWVWKNVQAYYVEVKNQESGKTIRLNPDDYDFWLDDLVGDKIENDLGLINESLKESKDDTHKLSTSNERSRTWFDYYIDTTGGSEEDIEDTYGTREELSGESNYYADLLDNGKKIAELEIANFEGDGSWASLGIKNITSKPLVNALERLDYETNSDIGAQYGKEIGGTVYGKEPRDVFSKFVSEIEHSMNSDPMIEGVSKDMTSEEIAKKHNVSVDKINKQLDKGIKVEKEHTNDEKKARRIALDHLFEIPDYYDRLGKMEKGALKETAPLSKRKPYRVFAIGDKVKYVNNNGWSDGGKKDIGRIGTIVDYVYQGAKQIFSIQSDDHREFRGYNDDYFSASADNLEFVDESLTEDTRDLKETQDGKTELDLYINNTEWAYNSLTGIIDRLSKKKFSKDSIINYIAIEIYKMKDDFGRIPTTREERLEIAKDFVETYLPDDYLTEDTAQKDLVIVKPELPRNWVIAKYGKKYALMSKREFDRAKENPEKWFKEWTIDLFPSKKELIRAFKSEPAYKSIFDGIELNEDTVKTSSGKWVNKGKEGTHGTFKTKKAADAQRKAMFANGYKENLKEEKVAKVDGMNILQYVDNLMKTYNMSEEDAWNEADIAFGIGEINESTKPSAKVRNAEELLKGKEARRKGYKLTDEDIIIDPYGDKTKFHFGKNVIAEIKKLGYSNSFDESIKEGKDAQRVIDKITRAKLKGLDEVATDALESGYIEKKLDELYGWQLAALWSMCMLSEENDYSGQPYDDEVYDAISKRRDGENIFELANEIYAKFFKKAKVESLEEKKVSSKLPYDGLSYEEQELAEYLFDEYAEHSGRHNSYISVDLPETNILLDEVHQYYDDRITKKQLNNAVKALSVDADVEMYEGSLQLSDEPVLQFINVDIPEDEYDAFDAYYWEEVDNWLKKFDKDNGVETYYAGRGGRHVIIDKTAKNFINYKVLRDRFDSLKSEFIKYIESQALDESLKESMGEEVRDWWDSVESWNRNHGFKYMIDNYGVEDEDLLTAMYDMLKEIKNDDEDLYNRGKKIYNKYAKSKITDSLKESVSIDDDLVEGIKYILSKDLPPYGDDFDFDYNDKEYNCAIEPSEERGWLDVVIVDNEANEIVMVEPYPAPPYAQMGDDGLWEASMDIAERVYDKLDNLTESFSGFFQYKNWLRKNGKKDNEESYYDYLQDTDKAFKSMPERSKRTQVQNMFSHRYMKPVTEGNEIKRKIKEYPRGSMVPEYLWTAVCNKKYDRVRKYFESGKEPNKRYSRFGGESSLIMGALRNGDMEMVDLLKSFGETIIDDEKKEYDTIMKRMSK